MYKLFKFQYEKYLFKYLFRSEVDRDPKKIVQNIFNFNKKHIPRDYILLKKFPMNEIKTIAKLECQIEGIETLKDQETVIDSFKKLRKMYDIKEKSICMKCSKKSTCKFFEELPDKNSNPNLIDLQIVLTGVYNNFNKNENNRNSEIENRNWNSASIVTEILNETIEDLLNNNGVSYKTLVNALIESKKEEEEEKVEILNKQIDVRKEREEDPVIVLIGQLKLCKNRREKKILLAKYNRSVGIPWGEKKKVPKEHYDTPKQSTEKFSQKILYKKAKKRQLEGQQNLSLLMNQGEQSEKTFVKIPGSDYRKAISYLPEDRKGNFLEIIENAKDSKSLDIKQQIKGRLNKKDLKLLDNKLITLKVAQTNQEKMKQLEQEKLSSHNVALLPFENQIGSESKENKEVDAYKTNNITIESTNSNKIQFEKMSSLSKSENFEFYVQKNNEKTELIKKKQHIAKLKKLNENKHIYNAENFYNNTNIEHINYEKDADISRALRFEKEIKKSK